jgi:hypothetical protein
MNSISKNMMQISIFRYSHFVDADVANNLIRNSIRIHVYTPNIHVDNKLLTKKKKIKT